MKQILYILIAILTIAPIAAVAQAPKKKVAVYLTKTDANPNYKKVIASKMVQKITMSPAFTAVERTSDFLRALRSEHDYSVSGEVRDSQIAKIGQKLGVKFVAVVDVTEMRDFEQVYVDARLINVESGEIVAISSVYDYVDNSMDKLIDMAEKVSSELTANGAGSTRRPASTPSSRMSGQPVETFNVNGVSFDMVRVDGGTFMMGSYDGASDEMPVHSETVATFYIGKTEVTVALWKAVMGSIPQLYSDTPTYPIHNVTWEDCVEFCDRLNRITGRNFRLPTEAEWEYAARGGNKSRGYIYAGSNDLDRVGWYYQNTRGRDYSYMHPVGCKLDNELGLYDMSGNVWEWTSDLYSYSYDGYRNGGSTGRGHVGRGGGYGNDPDRCRVTGRSGSSGTISHYNLGFRLAL